ncbi:MAG: rhodanese-like domain-containing protein [Bdellovibrionales bacterium]|nr:rhodanese-like domain-containing protein [Bdellovibrionales bacterium]
MTMKEFHDLLPKLGPNDIVVDVREPDEFREVRIRGTRNIPLGTVGQHVAELKKYDHVYIHCRRGGRAQRAVAELQAAGLTNLVCIGDWGMEAWIDAGFPVER